MRLPTHWPLTILATVTQACLVLEPAPVRPGSEEPANRDDGVRISGSDSTFGYAMTALGDVDGDGYGDLAISEPGYAEEEGADTVGAIYLVYGGTLQDPPEEALDPNHPELRWAAELGAVVCGESGVSIGAGLAAVQGISGAGVQLVSTTTEGRYAYVLRELQAGDAESCGGLESAGALELYTSDSTGLGGLVVGLNRPGEDPQVAGVGQPGARCTEDVAALIRVEGPVACDYCGTMADPVALPDDLCAGSALSAGDLDGDGHDELLIGVPGEVIVIDRGEPGTELVTISPEGTVYLATQEALEGCSDLETCADARFDVDGSTLAGFSLATGDLDGDGGLDVAVGAPANVEASGGQQVYVLDGSAFLEDEDGLVTTGDPAVFARVYAGSTDSAFGTSLAVPGDVFPDDADELAVGDPDGAEGGQVWLVYGPLSGVIDVSLKKTYARKLTDTGSDERIGETLAAAGDVNGDILPDLLVGPPLEPEEGDEADVFLWYLE